MIITIVKVVWKWDGQVGFGVGKARDRFGIRFMSFRIKIKYLLLCSRADVVYNILRSTFDLLLGRMFSPR